jgi:hypothetical protein
LYFPASPHQQKDHPAEDGNPDDKNHQQDVESYVRTHVAAPVARGSVLLEVAAIEPPMGSGPVGRIGTGEDTVLCFGRRSSSSFKGWVRLPHAM